MLAWVLNTPLLFGRRFISLKELRNHIFRIVRVRSLFFQYGFIEACVLYLLFRETTFCLSVFNLFSVLMSFEFDIIFKELQHLYNYCLYKCHLAISVPTS